MPKGSNSNTMRIMVLFIIAIAILRYLMLQAVAPAETPEAKDIAALANKRALQEEIEKVSSQYEEANARLQAQVAKLNDQMKALGKKANAQTSDLHEEIRGLHAELQKLQQVRSSDSKPAANPPNIAISAPAADCPDRKPFHVLLTAQSHNYNAWQSRIMYYHFKKQQKAAGPCTDMVAFTRLCPHEDGKTQDGLENEIPTIFVKERPASFIEAHQHFAVLNRPYSVQQLFDDDAKIGRIKEEFVLIAETDHVFLKPVPNVATSSMPAGFDFGYMHGHPGVDWVVKKYWPEGSWKDIDPVGPSPVIISKKQLQLITPKWMEFSNDLRSNKNAESAIQGWVQEMWGYSIACAAHGIKHKVMRDFQIEPGALTHGIPKDFHQKYFIFHYTYGFEYRMDGRAQGIHQIGEWSLDKRHYGGSYPPRNMEPPPDGANPAAYWLLDAWNEASSGIPDWPATLAPGTIGWRREKISQANIEASPLAKKVLGTKWKWGGIPTLQFNDNGDMTTPWGKGEWGIAKFSKTCPGCVFADFANSNHNLEFDWDKGTFKSSRVGDGENVVGTRID